MLNVLVAGRLVKPPKVGTSSKGTAWTSVSVRCPIQAQNDEQESDVLVNAISFGAAAERLARLGVGDSVAFNGDARLNHWTDREGSSKTGLSVTVSEVVSAYTARKKRGDAEPTQQGIPQNSTWGMAKSASQSGDFDDPISF